MAQSAATRSIVLKITFDGDTRRVNLAVSEEGPAGEILQDIRQTVAHAFDMDADLLPALKYQDDEGDLCTLVAASVDDMLQLNHGGVLRLFAGSVDDVSALDDDLFESSACAAVPQDENSVAVLTEMGFSREDAERALQEVDGNVKAAIEFLITGCRPPSTPLERLMQQLRTLPTNVAEQLQMGPEIAGQLQLHLRQMLANIKQHRANMQERYEQGDFEHLQKLQAALEVMKARLREYRDAVAGGMNRAKGAMPNAKEQLQKAEACIADSQQFLAEAIATLHMHGSKVPKSTTEGDLQNETLDSHASEGDAGLNVSTGNLSDGDDTRTEVERVETVDAPVKAAADTAEVAMSSGDDILTEDASSDIASCGDAAAAVVAPWDDFSCDETTGDSADAAEVTPQPMDEFLSSESTSSTAHEEVEAPAMESVSATAVDHAQIFFARSMASIRWHRFAPEPPRQSDCKVDAIVSDTELERAKPLQAVDASV